MNYSKRPELLTVPGINYFKNALTCFELLEMNYNELLI